MKRFVERDWAIVLIVTVLTLAVSSLVHPDEKGLLLIAIGFLAIVICVQRVVETNA
jgi:hypothetical protein